MRNYSSDAPKSMAATEKRRPKLMTLSRAAEFAAKDAALRQRETHELPDTCYWHNQLLILNEKLPDVSPLDKYRKSVEVFSRLRLKNIPPDSLTYALCIRAAAKANLPVEAELLFARMKLDRVIPSRFHFHALMSAWEGVRNLRKVQQVFEAMVGEGLKPDRYTFNILVSACRGWREAEEILLWQMPEASVEADEYTFNSWLKVCVRAGEVAAAERAWSAFKASGLSPDYITLKIVGRLTKADGFQTDIVAQEIVREVSEKMLASGSLPKHTGQAGAWSERWGEPGNEAAQEVEARRKSGSEASSSDAGKTASPEATGAYIEASRQRVAGNTHDQPVLTQSQTASSAQQVAARSSVDRELFREALERHAEADRRRMGMPTGFRRIQVPRFGKPRIALPVTLRPSQGGSFPAKVDLEDPPGPTSEAQSLPPPTRESARQNDLNIEAAIGWVKERAPNQFLIGPDFWRRFKEDPKPKRPPEWLLDLHGYSDAETREVVVNKLEALAEPEGVKEDGSLTLVTSTKRFSPRPSPIQNEIKGMLTYYGIKYKEGPGSGKLTVPSGAITEFAATREKKQLKQRIVKSAAGRYIGFGALVFAAVSLTPLLLDRYAKKEERTIR